MVNWPTGQDTTGVTVYFQYWQECDPDNKTRVDTTFSGTGSLIPFSATVNGLLEDTTYDYHAVATVNEGEPAYGEEQEFTTTYPWTIIIDDSADDAATQDPDISTVLAYRGPQKVAFKVTGHVTSEFLSGNGFIAFYFDEDKNSETGFQINDIGANRAVINGEVVQWDGDSWVDVVSVTLHSAADGFYYEIPLNFLGGDGQMNVVAQIGLSGYGATDTAPNSGHGTTTQYTLMLATPSHGTVDIDPAQALYYEGTSVTLTANPDIGWQFDEWSGPAITGDNQYYNPLTLTMDENKAISVTFSAANPVNLELSPSTDSLLIGQTFYVDIIAQAGATQVIGARRLPELRSDQT